MPFRPVLVMVLLALVSAGAVLPLLARGNAASDASGQPCVAQRCAGATSSLQAERAKRFSAVFRD